MVAAREDNYEDQYSKDGIFGDFTYSSPGVSRGLLISMIVRQSVFFAVKGKIKVLVMGAGHGYEVVSYIKGGYDVKAIDLYSPDIPMVKEVTTLASADNMPFEDKEFDLIHSTEMMEHVPQKLTNPILRECKRVAKRFVFTIATRDDPPYCTHINIHPAWWWIKKFEKLGFNIVSAQQAARLHIPFPEGHASHFTWPDGVLIYGEC